MKKLIILLTVAVCICVAVTAMAAGDGIAFDPGTETINEGATLQTVLTREGAAADGEVTYTSSNPKMATVDENGLVTALKKGRVVITAVVKVEKKTYKAQLKLNVIRPAASVTVDTAKLPVYAATDEKVTPYLTARENAEENELPVLLLQVKKKLAVKAVVEPKDASDRNVTFASSDESVFTAVKNTLTGVAPGEAILTVASASNPEITARYRVLVVQPVKKLTIGTSEPSVLVGGQITATAKADPEDATMKSVIWASGNEKLLTIDANGVVTGVKHGNGRIIATAADGSKVRANANLKVIQNPESIELASNEVTIDVGRTMAVKATVLPKDTDNKKLIWTSSDESVATVDRNGRIKALKKGECMVTCRTEALENITATIAVHAQQPVKKVYFNSKLALVYVDETTQLSWTTEPDDASNPTLEFKSSNEKIVTVDQNGVVTGVKSGKTKIIATTTDGSKRKANIAVQAGRHVSGVQMRHKHAYIDPGEKASTTVTIEPKDALNTNMSFESSDPNVVNILGYKNKKMSMQGGTYGEAVITGTSEDGGFQTSIAVTVGDFENGVSFLAYGTDNAGKTWLTVRNNTNYNITHMTATLELWDCSGEELEPAVINTKTGSNKVDVVWSGVLGPGQETSRGSWKMVNFMTPSCGMNMTRGQVTLINYQIEGDWVKNLRHKPYKYWN